MNSLLMRRTSVPALALALTFGCSDSGGSNTASGGTGAGATGGAAAGAGMAGKGGGSGGMSMTPSLGGSAGSVASGAGGGAGTPANGGSTAAGAGAPAGGAGGSLAGSSGAGGSSGTMASGSGGLGGSAGAVAISGLMIEPNPNSVLSCFVSWKTDVAASSAVQFGAGEYEWEISDEAPVTDHRVTVIGMHAATDYAIKAISGAASAEGMFTTGALPSAIPVAMISINDAARVQPGWTLMNMQKLDTAGADPVIPNSTHPPAAVIYDEGGEPVWYYIDGTSPDNGGAVSTQLTDVGILIGPTWNSQQKTGTPPREVDFAGNIVWECKHKACTTQGSVSHHAAKLPNGHYIVNEDVTGSNDVKSPVWRELTSDSEEVWKLDVAALLPPPSDARTDWCHGNSITIDQEKNVVYANCRWTGLLKTTYDNPTYQWFMPASCQNLGLGDITYMGSQYVDSHDPEIHADGTIIFFDNGGWNTRCMKDSYHSRVVEYQVDEAAKKATLVWEFPGSFTPPDAWYDWYSPYWGDADRLANGNVLVAAGVLSNNKESRVFEVGKEDGKVVYEMRFPKLYGMYRADRINPPLVHPIGQQG